MRKIMTKEITSTTAKVATIEVVDGVPSAVQLPDEIILGNVTADKAQKILSKKLGKEVTVFSVHPETQTYELPVEEFIKIATLKKEDEELPDAQPAE